LTSPARRGRAVLHCKPGQRSEKKIYEVIHD
jgi:hypothetical protein